VKTAIRRLQVLSPAESAHVELFHGGVFPVVGQPFDDCETGSAVSASDEEIVVTGVLRVSKFLEARVAYGYIWRYNGS
jgi:hypothetical protein